MKSRSISSRHSLRRRILSILSITSLGLVTLGISTPPAFGAEKQNFANSLTKIEKTNELAVQQKATQLREKMNLDEKLGQLIWTHVYGSDANEVTADQASRNEAVFGAGVNTPAKAIKKWKLGGILYFNWSGNIGKRADLKQIARLSNGLQDAAQSTGAQVPLAITVDQEGGIVARLRGSTTDFPGNMALGATRSPELAQQQGKVMGRELKAVGINVDFAPVVDVNTNPQNPVIGIRSIGSDPDLVSKLSSAQIKGLQAEGVSATAKHFPGHGDTSSDSHTSLPVVNYDRQTLNQHLRPFQAAIDSGVDMIMTAHVIAKAIDPDQPATLSKAVLTDLLRKEMGFKGIITTDAIDMEGAQLAVMTEEESQHYQDWKCKGTTSINGGENTTSEHSADCVALMKHIRGEVTVKAVAAGSDIVLNTYDVAASVDGLKDALTKGTISQKQIDDSVDRVLAWKIRRGVIDNPKVDLSKIDSVVKNAEAKQIAYQLATKSVTLVKNKDNVLPLHRGAKVLVTGSTYGNPEKLEPRLADLGFETTFKTTAKRNPTDAEIAEEVAAAQQVDYVVYTSNRAYTNEPQQKAVRELSATGKPVIVVTTNVPYDSAALPSAAAILNLYGNQDPNHEGAARALAGIVSPAGELPVAVPANPDIPGSEALAYGLKLSYPASPLELQRAVAEAPQSAPFVDVEPAMAFAGEISWLKDSKVTTGWPDNTFRPVESISREAFATFLYRLIKSTPGATTLDLEKQVESPFSDYENGKFSQEVSHMAQLGVIKGWPDGTFRPLEPISREAVAAMIHRVCDLTHKVCSPAIKSLPTPNVVAKVFRDVGKDNQFVADIQWLKDAQVTTGWADETFRPQEPVHRDAMAAFIYRLTKNQLK